MRIDSLKLRNIRVLEGFSASFQPHFNLIVGKNGTGKTTILEMMARILSNFTPVPKSLLMRRDQRVLIREGDGRPFEQDFSPCQLEVAGEAPDGSPFSGSHCFSSRERGNLQSDLAWRRDQWFRRESNNPTLPLPLMAFYSPRRNIPRVLKPKLKVHRPNQRMEGYKDAFDGKADLKDISELIKTYTLAGLQEGRQFLEVESAREAMARCLPDCIDVRYLVRFDDVMLQRKDGSFEPLWRLSDGYRTMAALVGEMAWRAAILNPLGVAGTPKGIRGVVLVDELDLHLHPAWQRTVVETLKSTFPHIQFIATTHSPFIIQSMEANEVINLDGNTDLDYQRKSIEDIAEIEMGLENVQRSDIFNQKVEAAKVYLIALEGEAVGKIELNKLKERLDEIQTRFGADPVYVASLLRKRAARGIE